MKATDLMIGDWVLKPFICDIESLKIGQLELDDFADEEEYGVLSACEPIPLTPDILEKNGFEKYPYANSYWYCDDMLELFVRIVCIFPIKDRELHSSLPTPEPRLTAGEDYVYIRCDYVHELQHALKLCGIEKEIVL